MAWHGTWSSSVDLTSSFAPVSDSWEELNQDPTTRSVDCGAPSDLEMDDSSTDTCTEEVESVSDSEVSSDFPLLRALPDWHPAAPAVANECQSGLDWSTHLSHLWLFLHPEFTAQNGYLPLSSRGHFRRIEVPSRSELSRSEIPEPRRSDVPKIRSCGTGPYGTVPRHRYSQWSPSEEKPNEMFFTRYRSTRQIERQIECTIGHTQLRHLVVATSKHDVYAMSSNRIYHWDAHSHRKEKVLDFVASPPTRHMNVMSIAAFENMVAAGGPNGEIVVKDTSRNKVVFDSYASFSDKAITNSIDLSRSPESQLTMMTCSNDKFVRMFDAETFAVTQRIKQNWAVNHASRQPSGGKLLIVGGDDAHPVLTDLTTGENVHELNFNGEFDNVFATGWHPDGRLVAVGNEYRAGRNNCRNDRNNCRCEPQHSLSNCSRDRLHVGAGTLSRRGSEDDNGDCRIWDFRYPKVALCSLRCKQGAIRSLKFSSDGKLLCLADNADHVFIYDVNGGLFCHHQDINLKEEAKEEADSIERHDRFLDSLEPLQPYHISGMSLTPDDQSLFIGVVHQQMGSLVEYERKNFQRVFRCRI